MTSGDSIGYVIDGPRGSVEFTYEEWKILRSLVAWHAGHAVMGLPKPHAPEYRPLYSKMMEAG